MISLLFALSICIVVSMTVSSSPESCQEAPAAALEDTVNGDLLQSNGRFLMSGALDFYLSTQFLCTDTPPLR